MRLMRSGIDTYSEPIVYMRPDCDVCRSEGFVALTRVLMRVRGKELVATVNVVTADWLEPGVAGLSESAWVALQPLPEDTASFSHPEPASSAGALRAKVFGQRLGEQDFLHLMRDAVSSRLSDIELAAFVTACAGDQLDHAETTALTRAMIAVGRRLDWGGDTVLDKHCVGGLPGNRTTPIVVAIVAAAGHRIPKTSSRAITSPAGTADVMEQMAPVELEIDAMRRVVEREGGCVIWGGRVRLSPADDVLIHVERPLDFDSEGQMVASVVSKKVAAGSTHVLIDMPVGQTAKVRSHAAATSLSARFEATAQALGVHLAIRRTDGSQPVGVGVGPALEAHDVLAVLRGEPGAPADLRDRALDLATDLLELTPRHPRGTARAVAEQLLASGEAHRKFIAICEAQGGFREPRRAKWQATVDSAHSGRIIVFDNRRLAKIAKLAGAPGSPLAGVECRIRLGDHVMRGQPLYVVHAESEGQLQYALDFANSQPSIIGLESY
jgi:thymidine phosphorylase